MAKYTDKNLYIEPRLVNKLDLYISRIKKKFDNVVLIDGAEGFGKSTLCATCCYYIAWKFGGVFNVDNIFFETDKMMEYAINNDLKIIDWDEAALSGLASDWQTKFQRQLLKMFYTARKKRHFYFICIPKFYKLKEEIIDRAVGMIRVYSRDRVTRGTFVYYNKNSMDKLYEEYRRTKKIQYKKYSRYPGCFHGMFTDNMDQVIDIEAYEKKKDAGIASILEDKKKEIDKKLITIQYKISKVKSLTKAQLAKEMGISYETLCHWQNLPQKYPFLLEERGFQGMKG